MSCTSTETVQSAKSQCLKLISAWIGFVHEKVFVNQHILFQLCPQSDSFTNVKYFWYRMYTRMPKQLY